MAKAKGFGPVDAAYLSPATCNWHKLYDVFMLFACWAMNN